jgi:hypothetical protein
VDVSTEQSDELTAPQQQTLVESFWNFPLVAAELDFEREPDYGRDISLWLFSRDREFSSKCGAASPATRLPQRKAKRSRSTAKRSAALLVHSSICDNPYYQQRH